LSSLFIHSLFVTDQDVNFFNLVVMVNILV